LALRPPGLVHHEPLESCAVVSSSGALLSHDHGSDIDRHAVVIRFNDAPTLGYEHHVGKKETIRITNMKAFIRSGRHVQNGTHYLWADPLTGELPRDDRDALDDLLKRAGKDHVLRLEGSPFEELSTALRGLFAERWWRMGLPKKSFTPTTGAIGMLLALTLCNSTTSYDMAPSNASATAPYHYYNNIGSTIMADDNTWHKTFNAERELWARLSITPAEEMRRTGKASLPGLSTVTCDGADMQKPPPHIALVVRKGSASSGVGSAGQPPQRQTASVASAASGSVGAASVQLVLAAVLAACLLSGSCYLLWLWHSRGLLSHLHRCLREPSSVRGAAALAVYLVMLVSLDLLVKREAERGHGRYATSPFVLVPLVELGKLVVSVALHLATTGLNIGTGAGSADALLANTEDSKQGTRAWLSCWGSALAVAPMMLPVAILFNINNLLNFAVLARVRLDAYAVWRNMSIFFNALVWVWALRRRLEIHRWVAISACMMGCCLNSFGPDGRPAWDAAVCGVLLSALLSSMASVCNERVIKSDEASQLTIDKVNIILYSETLLLMLCGCSFYLLTQGPHLVRSVMDAFGTFTPGAGKIVAMQVCLGLSVSRVLKHSDAVAKTVVGSLRDVVLVLIAPGLVVGTRLDWLSLGSACLVGLAGLIYFNPAAAPSAAMEKPQEVAVAKPWPPGTPPPEMIEPDETVVVPVAPSSTV